jgi:Tfp pilus assembly major pilin PilA
MTYMDSTRTAAIQESRALRGWAVAGRRPPRCAPIDYWREYQRVAHTNDTTFGKAAA